MVASRELLDPYVWQPAFWFWCDRMHSLRRPEAFAAWQLQTPEGQAYIAAAYEAIQEARKEAQDGTEDTGI